MIARGRRSCGRKRSCSQRACASSSSTGIVGGGRGQRGGASSRAPARNTCRTSSSHAAAARSDNVLFGFPERCFSRARGEAEAAKRLGGVAHRGRDVAKHEALGLPPQTVLQQEGKLGVAVGDVLFPRLQRLQHVAERRETAVDVLRLLQRLESERERERQR